MNYYREFIVVKQRKSKQKTPDEILLVVNIDSDFEA